MYAVMYFGICIYGTYRQLKFVNIISSISNGRYSPSRRFQILLQNSPFSVNLKISLHFEKNHNRITRNDQSFMYKQEKKTILSPFKTVLNFVFQNALRYSGPKKMPLNIRNVGKSTSFYCSFFIFGKSKKITSYQIWRMRRMVRLSDLFFGQKSK